MPNDPPPSDERERDRDRDRDRALSRRAALGALGLGALALGGCRAPKVSEVVFGAVGALTGSRAVWGNDLLRGMMLAVDQANARGGVLGRRVRLAVEDGGSHDEQAASLVSRLCDREGAVAVFGEVSTTATERAAAAAQRRGVPFVAAGNTQRDVTRAGDFVFRTVLTDAEQVIALAKYARGTLQKRRAAIVHRRSSLLHLALADAFGHAFRTTASGEVVMRDTFTGDDDELVQLAAHVRASQADVLFIPALGADAARVALAARHGRVTAQVLGNDGWVTPEIRRFPPEATAGAIVTDVFCPTAPRPEVDQFVQTFRERHHALPGSFAAMGYDAMRWVITVAARVPSLEPRALRDALAGSQLEGAVGGPFSVDTERVLRRSANLMRVERDGFSFVALAPP